MLGARQNQSGIEVEDSNQLTTRRIMRNLFSRDAINEERKRLQGLGVWDEVSQSYEEVEQQKNRIRSMMNGIPFDQFKQALLDKRVSEQLIVLAEIINEEIESEKKSDFTTLEQKQPRVSEIIPAEQSGFQKSQAKQDNLNVTFPQNANSFFSKATIVAACIGVAATVVATSAYCVQKMR